MKNSTVTLVSAMCVLALLSGCGQTDKKADSTAPADKSAATKPADSTAKTADSTAPATDAAAPKTDAQTTASADPNAPKSVKIDLQTLPDDLVICTVGGTPIKVGEYRRMLKLRTLQMQNQIAANPVLRETLLAQAKQMNLTLTADEKTKLMDAAKAEHPNMEQFLKERNMTQKDLENEVTSAGLMYKAANAALEQSLLNELVQRELLCNASTKSGLEKKAMDKYLLVKQTRNFKSLKDQSGLPQDDLRDELVKGELASYQIEKIAKNVHVSEAEIKDAYNKNKNNLMHNERVRLSTILVLAPEQDLPGIPSVRNQVLAANSKLTGKDLDATIAQVMQAKQNSALVLLGEAQGAKDFAKLANENTEDVGNKIAHNGGDMGWQEKSQLVPQFVDAVWELKPGTVFPKLVKTGEGFRIVKVTGHEKPGPMSLAEVHGLLESKLKQDKLQQTVNAWVAEQEKTTKIEFSPRFLAQANGNKNATH